MDRIKIGQFCYIYLNEDYDPEIRKAIRGVSAFMITNTHANTHANARMHTRIAVRARYDLPEIELCFTSNFEPQPLFLMYSTSIRFANGAIEIVPQDHARLNYDTYYSPDYLEYSKDFNSFNPQTKLKRDFICMKTCDPCKGYEHITSYVFLNKNNDDIFYIKENILFLISPSREVMYYRWRPDQNVDRHPLNPCSVEINHSSGFVKIAVSHPLDPYHGLVKIESRLKEDKTLFLADITKVLIKILNQLQSNPKINNNPIRDMLHLTKTRSYHKIIKCFEHGIIIKSLEQAWPGKEVETMYRIIMGYEG